MSSTTTSLSPGVLRMAAPLVVSFTLRGAFTLVDTIYAALLGDSAVAAIGLTVPLEFLMIALWVGMSTGLTSNLSRSMGAGENEKIRQYIRATWRLIWIAAPAFTLAGAGIWIAAPAMGLEPEVARDFRVYGAVLVAGSAWTAFWSVIPDSIVKAHQDTRSTMWAGILSSILNVILNTLFLFVFHWGVFGIAFSTVLGRIGGLLYAISRARHHEARRLAEAEGWAEGRDPRPFASILGLAVPASLTFGLMATETGIINWLLSFSANQTEAIAAYSIYYRVQLFLLNPIIATAVAMLPYVARRYGQQDFEGIRRGLKQAGGASLLYTLGVVAPGMYLAGPHIARWLAESDLTAQFTRLALLLVPAACLTSIPFLLCRPVFEGMRRGRPGLWMALLRYAVLSVPGAWVGMEVAKSLGSAPLFGLLIGLLVVAAGTSLLFLGWLRHALQGQQAAM